MTSEEQDRVAAMIGRIPCLTEGQLHWLERVVAAFGGPHEFAAESTDLLDDRSVSDFGDALRVHHCFSVEPFSKNKFEYVLQVVLTMAGRAASLAPKGHRGHDIVIDGVRVSLKTQANKDIRDDKLWISKFMELGKGK